MTGPVGIESFVGPRPSGGTIRMLDLFPGLAVGAYSFRKLRSAYDGPCIRVRRSSDNAEQDIGFAGSGINLASLLAFCGAGSGFAAISYDQSGNGNHRTQTTAGNQLRIVNGGEVVTDSGFTAFDCSTGFFVMPITQSIPLQVHIVHRLVSTSSVLAFFFRDTDQNPIFVWDTRQSDRGYRFGSGTLIDSGDSSDVTNDFRLASVLYGESGQMRINKTQFVSGDTGSLGMNGIVNVWASDTGTASDRQAYEHEMIVIPGSDMFLPIEAAIADHYGTTEL